MTTSPAAGRLDSMRMVCPHWALIAMLLAQWALLTAGLARQSMWIDEWFTVDDISSGLGEVVPRVIAAERRPPLYFALVATWMRAAGTSELAIRLLSVGMAALLVAATYRLARCSAGRRPALLAAALVAFSPFLLLYSRMIRSYALFALLAVLATWALLRLARRPTPGRWLAYGLLAMALLYVDYGGLAVAGVHGLWALAHLAVGRVRRGRGAIAGPPAAGAWAVVAALGAAGAAFGPWAFVLLRQAQRSVTGTAADLSGGTLGLALKAIFPITALGAGETLYPWNPIGLLGIVASGLLATVGAAALLRRRPAVGWLLLAWIGGAVLFTAVVLSAVAVDITFLNAASRAPHLAPAYAVLVAAGAARLRPASRTLGLAAVAGAFAVASGNYFLGREFLNPIYAVPIRAVAQAAREETTGEDLLVAESDTLFGYYYRQAAADADAAAYIDADDPDWAIAAIDAQQPRRVWVLVYGRDRTAGFFATQPLAQRLAQDYAVIEQRGYGATGASYRWVKERLLHRPAYTHKLTVTIYERRP